MGSYPRPSRLAEALVVRPARAQRGAEALGLRTVGELLEHIPFRHEDRRERERVVDLRAECDATVMVGIRSIRARPVRRRGMRPKVEALVADETGPMKAVWWNQPWVADRLPPGTRVILRGRYRGRNEFHVQEHEVAAADEPDATAAPAGHHSTGLVPVYPATEEISSKKLRELAFGVRGAERDVVDPLPAHLRVAERVADRPAALAAVHFPEADGDDAAGRRRLAFEHLLVRQLVLHRRRARRRRDARAPSLDGPCELTARWLSRGLPFELTGDQRRAIATIDAALAAPTPMQHLLMGEVGAGKTVVALSAMLRAADHDMQAALMAPTETLAEQHFATLARLLGDEVLPVALLTGATPARRRAETLARLSSGELRLVVGTHALIEEEVTFDRLAVVVVDEQHRFGVRQRQALDRKGPPGAVPHVLHMTATPIPRTLALTAYGFDFCTLRELPRGRKPIETVVAASAAERRRAYARVRDELAAGRQAFVVCPLIEESEALAGRAATAEYERLARTELEGFDVALLHGQMRSADKQSVMAAFAAGQTQVLVCTSVVEVGIDVPNATAMVVESAERYGISQLHQLRGRVGRGDHRSWCFLFGPRESERLRALAAHDDGFALAEIDLRLRGEGELVGTRQSGIADHDPELLERANARAEEIVAADIELESPEHALLADEVRRLSREPGRDAGREPIPA